MWEKIIKILEDLIGFQESRPAKPDNHTNHLAKRILIADPSPLFN